jgi:hypothetical protein
MPLPEFPKNSFGIGGNIKSRCCVIISFHDLGDAGENRLRDRQAELLRGVEVRYQFDLARCLTERPAGFAPPENLVDVGGEPPKLVRAGPLRHQATGIDHLQT